MARKQLTLKNMKKKNNFKCPGTFEKYMRKQHALIFPEVLDDDLPDHFDDWVAGLQADDWMEWGDVYAKRWAIYNRYRFIRSLGVL